MNYFSRLYKSCTSIPNKALECYNLDDISFYGLDFQAKIFFESYYDTVLKNEKDFDKYLSLWRYEALLSIGQYAKENSLFYKNLTINFENLLSSLQTQIKENNIEKDEIDKKFHEVIQAIPVTEVSSLAQDSLQFLAIAQDSIEGLVSVETSGTSSNSTNKKRIYCSEKDFESTIQFFFFGMQYILRNTSDKVAMLMSGERIGSIGHLFSIAMERLHIPCRVFEFSIDYQKLAKELVEFEATCVVAIPWHIMNISSYINENSISHSITKVLLSADTASEELKEQLAQNLNCEVFDHYGVTEFGFGGAVECMAHKALHLRALDLYIEIVDDNLKPVENDNFGEILITTFTREAMPLIRYRIGDKGRIISKKCPCGSQVPCLEIEGRISQAITRSKGIIHFSEFQNFFFSYNEASLADFDICELTHANTLEKILLVGVDIVGNIKDKTNQLEDLKQAFGTKFNLIQFNKNSSHIQMEIEKFYICSMSEYLEIFKRNLYTDEVQATNTNSLDTLINKTEAEKKNNIITAKKNIRHLTGLL